jgi:NDP-sugar pyrophosphorylase family protein
MEDREEGRFAPGSFLDLGRTEHAQVFADGEPVWSAIGRIAGYLESKGGFTQNTGVAEGAFVGERVHLGEGVKVEHGAVINGPAWIGAGTIVRTGAYIRGNLITGENCVLGNSCEFKNCLLFDNCQVPHFNYVGDSILGYKVHLGAGVILSNVRLDNTEVQVRIDGGENLGSGLRKFGAVIGDAAEIGCNTVINPGSIIGRRSVLYPGSMWSGVLAEDHIVKVRQVQEVVARKD